MTEKKTAFYKRNKASGGYLLRHITGSFVLSVVRYILLTGLCFMIISPLITRFLKGIMPMKDLFDNTIILIPRHPTFENFKIVMQLTNLPLSMLNTIWTAGLVSVCQVISCTLVAYAFARFEYPFKKFWYVCVLVLIIVPPQTLEIPLFMHFINFDIFSIFRTLTGKSLNLRGTVLPYTIMSITCMGFKNGLYIFMLKEYFKGIPVSLEEAAYIDGCGNVHTFARIMLPDAFPIITSCFLFSFVWQWTDEFYTNSFLSGYKIYSSQMAALGGRLTSYYSNGAQQGAQISPAVSQQMIAISVLICCVPLIVLYCFAQKSFVQSIAVSGMKE